jgi:membrane fusion protein (multidrug efflux system)
MVDLNGLRLKEIKNRITRFPPIQKATSLETWQNGRAFLARNPRAKKFLVTLLILLLVWKVSKAVAAYLSAPRINMTMSPIAGALAVSAQPVQRGTIARTVTYTGSVLPTREAPITPRIQGWVRAFLVNAGERVQAGQPLVLLDTVEIAGHYQQARANEDFWAAELVRAEKLVKGGAISQSEYDRTKMMYEEASGQAQAARARLDYTIIRAPFTGLVTERVKTINEGQLVGPGVRLLTVGDVRRMRVQVKVAETDLPYVRVGTEAKIRFPTLSDSAVVDGKVATVFPDLDAVTRTSTVEVLIDNPRRLIRPDMYAVADLVLEKRASALIVPRSAVVELEGKPTVFVTDGVTASARAVTLGIQGGDSVEIRDGVKQGDLVIYKGNRGLVDGQLVKLVQF